jgi:hypothetical protein
VSPGELPRAGLLALPALVGVALLGLLGEIDLASAANQRALVLALVATLLVALALNRWLLRRSEAELERELDRRLLVTDQASGLGNRQGMERALSSDLRGICTLVELRPEPGTPSRDFASVLLAATRREQDELFHDDGRYWALLHETSPKDAEVVLDRVRRAHPGPLAIGRARYTPGEPLEAWLQRATPES